MLNYIRSNTHSWGVKFAFGIIVIVFVFWGLGSVQNMGSSAVIATVNGQVIVQHDFMVQYQNEEENIRLNNPNITKEELENMGIGHQVLQRMIVDTLLREEARRIGLSITPLELFKTIEQIPSFHNAQGKFDKDTYLNILKAQRVSPGKFEEDVRKSLLEEKLKNQVTEGTYITSNSIRALYDFSREQRVVEYVYFPSADYMGDTPSEKDINNYYENNKNLFTIPAQIKVDYILLSAAGLGDATKITEQEISDYYTKKQDSFAIPGQVDVSHILIILSEDAEAEAIKAAEVKMDVILKELSLDKKFEDIAEKYSEDAMTANVGGKIGFIQKGDTVEEFENAAFALKENEVSGIVRTPFGLHLIKVNKKEDARLKSLDEVSDEIAGELMLQAGNDNLYNVLDLLVEGNIVGTPLVELAEENKLAVETSDLLTALEIQEKLNISDRDAQLLMQSIEGSPYETAIETLDGGFIIAKILETKQPAIEPLASVKDDIIAELKSEQAIKKALSTGEEIRKNMGDELAAEYKEKIQVSEVISRGQSIPGFENNMEINVAIFAANKGTWLPSAFQVYSDQLDGAVLVRVKDIIAAKPADWPAIEQMLTKSVALARKNEIFNLLIANLFAKANIQVENESIFNRTGL